LKQKVPLAGIKYARVALLFVAVAGLLSWLVWRSFSPSESAFAVSTTSFSQWGAGQGNPFGFGAVAPVAGALPAAAQEVPIDLVSTSLAGTHPDGQWAFDAQGQLRKDFALRQRLDYFLTLLGEQPLHQVRALVQQKARTELPESAVKQLMQLWDRYVQLQQHTFKTSVDLRQPSGWSAALLERQSVRRELLGADVAYAFYAHDERELQSMLARVNSGTGGGASASPETLASSIAPLADAPQREAQLQREWKEWDQRIEAARAQIQRLQASPELSSKQRQSAVQQLLASQFAEGTERLRAASLLGL
jgi:lipase chaperone LimK